MLRFGRSIAQSDAGQGIPVEQGREIEDSKRESPVLDEDRSRQQLFVTEIVELTEEVERTVVVVGSGARVQRVLPRSGTAFGWRGRDGSRPCPS